MLWIGITYQASFAGGALEGILYLEENMCDAF